MRTLARQDRARNRSRLGAFASHALQTGIRFTGITNSEVSQSYLKGKLANFGDNFDILLTELVDDGGHRFVVETGTDAGADVVAVLDSRPVSDLDRAAAGGVATRAAAAITRRVDTDGLRDRLYAAREHPQWDDIASRCLSCGNCTLVCPTCFCITTNDVDDLSGPIGRERIWDSCFVVEYSYIHGGPIRRSTQARYRQWLTHKFASWIDQFGTSGCVGCGRCITWCPAGIDITEELARLTAPRPTGSEREGE